MKKILIISTLILTYSCINPGSYENQTKIINSWAQSIAMKNPQVETISAKDLKVKLEQKDFTSILVDARSMQEQQVSVIGGAMPTQLIDQNPENYKDKTIIVYCTIGGRSSAYAKDLMERGFKVKSLYGGVLAWAQEGYDFNANGKSTKKVKFLNDAWNVLPKEYEGIVP